VRARGRAAPRPGPCSSAGTTRPGVGLFTAVFGGRLWEVPVPADSVPGHLRCPAPAVPAPPQRWLAAPVGRCVSEKVASLEDSFSLESRVSPGNGAGSPREHPRSQTRTRTTFLRRSSQGCVGTGCLWKPCTALGVFSFPPAAFITCRLLRALSGLGCLAPQFAGTNCSRTRRFCRPRLGTSDPIGSGTSRCPAHPGDLPASSSRVLCPSLMARASGQ